MCTVISNGEQSNIALDTFHMAQVVVMTRRPRILLIDDSQEFREALCTRLSSQGFDMRQAGSGQEGLEVVQREPFDLVLLDMLMPDKDGVTTYQELRANPTSRQIPVILLTAVAVEGHWEPMPYETDGKAFIMGKPYDYKLLLARINQVLTEASGGL